MTISIWYVLIISCQSVPYHTVWLRKAAAQDDQPRPPPPISKPPEASDDQKAAAVQDAQVLLGSMLQTGMGVKQDDEEAVAGHSCSSSFSVFLILLQS